MSGRTPTADRERVTALLQPVIAAAGFDLEQVSLTSAGRRSVLRVVVDADGGVSLDDVAEVGRIVSAALDAAGPAGSFGTTAYALEVSSPGVDRPLTEPRHWRRAVGRLVRTRIGDTRVEGRVASADGSGVMLDVGGTALSAPYAELGKGLVQVEFTRGEEDTA
jgi:ribosome maturation factor RimP